MVNRIKRHADPDRDRGKKNHWGYKERPASAFKSRAEQSGGRFDSPYKQGFSVFRPKAGSNIIRILPPTWPNSEHYGYDVWMHKYVGPDNSSYVCPRMMKQKPCPICDAERDAKAAGESDEAKALAPSKVVVCWIINRNSEDDPPMPELYPMSWSQDKDISSLCINKKTGATLSIDHPELGYDLSFDRTGQGLKTRYGGWQIDRDSTPVDDSPEIMDSIREYIEENPVPSTLRYYSTEHLEKVMAGTVAEKDDELDSDDDGDGDDGAENRRSSRKGGGKTKRPARAAADDDDDDAGDDEPPARRKKPAADDDDDGDDDEPPARRRPARSERRSSKDDDDDAGDDDAGDSDGDDDDDRSSRRKPARPARRSRDDEDDGDDAGDDDGDDDAPKGRVARRRPARGSEDDDDGDSGDDGDDDDRGSTRRKPVKEEGRRRRDPDPDEEELDDDSGDDGDDDGDDDEDRRPARKPQRRAGRR